MLTQKSTTIKLEKIKQELSLEFPDYTFFFTYRLFKRCLVIKRSKYNGADIYIRNNKIIIEPAIPDWKTRFMLGAGAAYKKITDPNFSYTAKTIKKFLENSYEVILR